jgi:threonine dehydrogenase-like Zn-dependent dehydrogenase
MQALAFDYTIPRYVAGKALGRITPSVYWSGISCLRYLDVPEPLLPGPDWARVDVKYGGICGSDLGLITLEPSTALAGVSSFPFVMGHENVGTISELGTEVDSFAPGDGVVVEPLLGCTARGFADSCLPCGRGDAAICERRTEGTVAAGPMTGFCATTGGSWSSKFVAHRSQLVRIPEGVSDENALLVEPFATGLRGVVRNLPSADAQALVLGSGVVGICVVAALRLLGDGIRIVVVAKHPFQAELANRYGADVVVPPGDDEGLADALGARLHPYIMSSSLVSGGADAVYDCVGSDASLDTAVRFTREGGSAVMLGQVAIPRAIDWTSLWYKEISFRGSYAYGWETWQGRRERTFRIAMDLLQAGDVDLAPLITHRFRLPEYRRALRMATHKLRHGLVKAIFTFD